MNQHEVTRPITGECILLLESEVEQRFAIRDHFEAQGFSVVVAESGATALELFRAQDPDLVLLDTTGEEASVLLEELLGLDPELPVILLVDPASAARGVEAVTRGADHFLVKPVAVPALRAVVERTLEHRRWGRLDRARRRREETGALDPLQGKSRVIRELAEQVKRISETEGAVLLTGERGTGKTFLASWIHHRGPRRTQPYLALGCAARTPERLELELFGHEVGAFHGAGFRRRGLLELAHQGTLGLEEIGNLPLELQPRLLTCLEEHRVSRMGALRDLRVDLRLIAGSSRDLARETRAGRFRADLYHRIGALPLRLPALRERPEDVPVLARAILGALCTELGRSPPEITTEALRLLGEHDWPGNLRELHNVLERALLRGVGRRIEAEDLHGGNGERGIGVHFASLEEVEQRHIEKALEEAEGHVGQAAKLLAVPRSTLYQRLKRLGISRSGQR